MGAGEQPEVGYTLQLDCLKHLYMSPRTAKVIGLDKPRGPKRRLTNTVVNIRPTSPSILPSMDQS